MSLKTLSPVILVKLVHADALPPEGYAEIQRRAREGEGEDFVRVGLVEAFVEQMKRDDVQKASVVVRVLLVVPGAIERFLGGGGVGVLTNRVEQHPIYMLHLANFLVNNPPGRDAIVKGFSTQPGLVSLATLCSNPDINVVANATLLLKQLVGETPRLAVDLLDMGVAEDVVKACASGVFGPRPLLMELCKTGDQRLVGAGTFAFARWLLTTNDIYDWMLAIYLYMSLRKHVGEVDRVIITQHALHRLRLGDRLEMQATTLGEFGSEAEFQVLSSEPALIAGVGTMKGELRLLQRVCEYRPELAVKFQHLVPRLAHISHPVVALLLVDSDAVKAFTDAKPSVVSVKTIQRIAMFDPQWCLDNDLLEELADCDPDDEVLRAMDLMVGEPPLDQYPSFERHFEILKTTAKEGDPGVVWDRRTNTWVFDFVRAATRKRSWEGAPKWGDFVLQGPHRKHSVHRAVLKIRSQYFGALLDKEWADATRTVYQVECSSDSVLDKFVRYLYGEGIWAARDEELQELVRLGDKYGVLDLWRDAQIALLRRGVTGEAPYLQARNDVWESIGSDRWGDRERVVVQ